MQTKTMSLVEQILNVGSGFFTGLLVWIFIIKPLFDIQTPFMDNVTITSIFTIVSVFRGYLWRRAFNYFSQRGGHVRQER